MVALGPMREDTGFFFDTHVHLDRLEEDQCLESELDCARGANVGGFLVPGVRPWDWDVLLETVRKIPSALAAPGIHPMVASAWDRSVCEKLRLLLKEPDVVALGEVGLDGLLPDVPLPVQEKAFREQVCLAVEAEIPLLIHCRKAFSSLLSILKQEQAHRVGGIFHGFSGSLEVAREAIRLNFAIAFGGPVTYPNARRAPQTLQAIPAEWVVLETDAPDLPPYPHQGSNNRPCYLDLIARKVAELRGWSLEETARITTQNAFRVLRIDNSYRDRYFPPGMEIQGNE